MRLCVRIINSEGVPKDPRQLSGMQEMQMPSTTLEVCKYIHCLQWMSATIAKFPERIAPLRDIVEEAYAISGSRTRRSIEKIRLSSLSRGPIQEEAFLSLQKQIRESVKLAHRNTTKMLCLFSDASE